MTALPPAQPAAAADAWLDLAVTRRVDEAADIVSVHLARPDGAELPPFRAGQHLVVDLPVPGGRPLRRTYTVSSAPSDRGAYRLTVKREPAAGPGLPAGQGSAAIHSLRPGDRLRVLPPRGDFVLDDSRRPVVLCAGGVGVTPMLAMLAELAEAPSPRRPVWMLHACRSPAHRPLGPEAAALAARHGAARLVAFDEADPAPGNRAGRLTVEALRQILPFDDYSFYLCGPAGFMTALHDGLRGLNVAPDRIAWESFGGTPSFAAPPPPAAEATAGPCLTFAASGVAGAFLSTDASILAAARRMGVDILHSCEEGVCGTCRCRLVAGEVAYRTDPIAWLEPGEVLTCISRPAGDVTLDV